MADVRRPVGLGLTGHGEVAQAVGYARQAAAAGLDSVFFHETYFERDAVTYAAAVARGVAGIRIGLGALNPNTRHPVLTAMTLSALDDMAPGRMTLALGTALPLRLAQLGIPYQPEAAIVTVSPLSNRGSKPSYGNFPPKKGMLYPWLRRKPTAFSGLSGKI